MMKKFAILISLFLSVSCLTEEIIKIGDDTPVPVMNAQLHAGDTLHRVFLNLSRLDRVEPLNEAVVKVYINDALAATAEWVEMEEIYSNSEYIFKADFNPGDRVRIEATKGSFHAKAEVTVPPAPSILSVKYEKVQQGEEELNFEYRYYVQIEDASSEDSFYRISMDKDVTVENYYKDNPVPKITKSDTHYVSVYNSDEPVISDGWMKEVEDDEDIMSLLSSLFMIENQFNIFTDERFRNETYTLKLRSDNLGFVSDFDYAAERIVCNPTVNIRVNSMSFLEYRYLISLCNFDTVGTDVNFISEPISLPSNVEGGIGFVSVESSACYSIEMPSWEQDLRYYEANP